ncbi:ester cyclase [Rhizobium sp. CAU 1783]
MRNLIAIALAGAALFAGVASVQAEDAAKAVPVLMEELAKYQQNEARIAKNLETFDTLDFDVYTHQKWDRLGESHAKDILVHYPDGSTTTGLHDHIEALKPMFVFAPDTRIEQHPVKFGSGEWTGVIGYLEGTFTKPMPIGNGKFIEPTGKPFKLGMSTLGHWTKNGVMDEEYLFWDNQSFMKQIGLAN